jgi:hypothetical protein
MAPRLKGTLRGIADMLAAVMQSPWFWWGLALLLLAIEALAPGTFMLWLAIAAAGTGLIDLVVPLGPTTEWIVFAVLALVSVGIGWQVRRSRTPPEAGRPLLNRRGEQLVGEVFVLETAIVDGRGRLKIGDAFWTAAGPDLPAGTRVRVLASDAGTLRVEAA